MKDKVTYRHNVMEINSLDTFFGIKGGCQNHFRDVYFIRALGECADFAAKIYGIDRQMETEVSNDRMGYLRIGELPNIAGGDTVQMYREIYDQWKRDRILSLSKVKKDEWLLGTISDALSDAEKIYQESRNGVSESMLTNFGIKMMFWLEETVGSCLDAWDERACFKVVLENVTKDQEYLFGYFLSMLGCDVLLLQNRADVNVTDALKKLSKTMMLGNYGTTVLSRYVPYVPQVREERRKEAAVQDTPKRENVKVVIPEHTRRNKGKKTGPVIPHREPVVVPAAVTVRNSRPVVSQADPQAVRTEKSFEELAQMASSIVMIAVHDRRGEVVGTGSGIMIGRNGFILTNNHVVAGGSFFSVRIEDDETRYQTDEVIKYHSTLDMAVIRIDRTLQPLPIYRGGKKLARGQKVVAIGSPLGMFNSVSDGIISGFRTINDTSMIQFTAPISPGSSGGAVLDMYGEVIGISTAGIDQGQNLNLAIGYEDILLFVRGFLG